MSYAIFVIGVLLKVPGSIAGKSVERSTIILEISNQRSETTTKRIYVNCNHCFGCMYFILNQKGAKNIGNFVLSKFANILLKMAHSTMKIIGSKSGNLSEEKIARFSLFPQIFAMYI